MPRTQEVAASTPRRCWRRPRRPARRPRSSAEFGADRRLLGLTAEVRGSAGFGAARRRRKAGDHRPRVRRRDSSPTLRRFSAGACRGTAGWDCCAADPPRVRPVSSTSCGAASGCRSPRPPPLRTRLADKTAKASCGRSSAASRGSKPRSIPDLIGGVVLRVGDTVYDGSVARATRADSRRR